MDYEELVASAPAGWRHFSIDDLGRLPAAVRVHEMARIPSGERQDRIVRALFWPLVYHLEPERWDALALSEPIPPALIDALPRVSGIALDVGAGTGRLTRYLVGRSGSTVAVEPSAGLRSILAARLPGVHVVGGWFDRLPLADACCALTAACAAFGPEPEVLAELRRVTVAGGTIALINPERPEWFEDHGWTRLTVDPGPPPPHAAWIDDFFGPPDPPRDLLMHTPRA